MSIERAAYSDPLVFREDMARLFAEHSYACSVFDLPTVNDYKAIQGGNRAITLRRILEGIAAFGNVCLHRNALIDPPGSGNRKFRCNYHGWRYDDGGHLQQAPLAAQDAICRKQLPCYPLAESSGPFFLGQHTAPDVSDVASALERINIVPVAPFSRGTLNHACNWKLLAENVLEGYHLSYVHQQTFVPAGFNSTCEYQYGVEGGMSWSTIMPRPGADRSTSYARISPGTGHYSHHAHVFPDLFLPNSNDLIGFLSHLQPLGSASTRLEWALFELPALSMLAAPIRQHFRKDAITFANATLLEDKALVESCQLGLSSEGQAYQLQPNEGRLAQFHSMYHERMAGMPDERM